MLKTQRDLAFLTDKIYNYDLFDKIWNFIIQKLKDKHAFLKKSTNSSRELSFAQFVDFLRKMCLSFNFISQK